jgi:hypothetical protein
VAIEFFASLVQCWVLNWKINKEYPWLKTAKNQGRHLLKKYPDVLKKTKQIVIHQMKDFLLTKSDEIMIFADGLYYGPTLNGDEVDGGYVKNVSRGCITIRQDEILETMNHDELYLHLRAKPTENNAYLRRKDNVPYERHNAKLTLEWR